MLEEKNYGYIRVGARDQNEEKQLVTLKEKGVPEDNIFIDKKSGKNFERTAYKRMLRILQKTICSTQRASISQE